MVHIEKLADADEVQRLQMPRDEALKEFTLRVVNHMEQVIRRYPQYWLWLYNRFRIK